MMEQQAVIDAIRAAAEGVFTTMLGLEVAAGEAFVERIPPGPSDGVISVVGLAGAWICSGSLCCSGHVARKISGSLLMAEFAEVDEEVLDAIAEITNMVFGNFKTEAEKSMGPLGLTVPTVVYGLKFAARIAGKENWTVIPFTCEGERFELKICVTPNRGLPMRRLEPGVSR